MVKAALIQDNDLYFVRLSNTKAAFSNGTQDGPVGRRPIDALLLAETDLQESGYLEAFRAVFALVEEI